MQLFLLMTNDVIERAHIAFYLRGDSFVYILSRHSFVIVENNQ